MPSKPLDLTKSVHELCRIYPDLIGVLHELGFSEITKKGMLDTVGRFMTIPKGAVLKKVDMNRIRSVLESNGYEIQE